MGATNPSPEQWSPTGPAAEIAPGFWRLPMPIPGHSLGGACAYLVHDREGYLLIDAGMDVPACREALAAHVSGIGVPFSALRTIVVTHGHADHGGQAPGLRERSGAPIWLHRRDAPLVSRERPVDAADPDGLVDWLARYGFPPEEAEGARRSVGGALGPVHLYEPDRLLDGGETFAAGPYRFEVIWTPGHTPGHVCIYEATRRLVLTGDHLFGRAAPNVRLMPYSPLDMMRQYIDSLRRIGELPAERGLPGHGEPFERVAERAELVVRHQLSRREHLRGLMLERPRTAYELAQVVWGPGARTTWDTFHARLRRNAALTLAAHLELLALDGEIARQDDGTVAFARSSRPAGRP